MNRPRRQTALVLTVLVALTLAVYLPVRNAGFVSDDDMYVKENSVVRAGLTARGALDAWTVPVASNWHPLTMLSLMLDAELFGPGPRGFHLMNVLYHLGNAVLAFLVLRRLTGAAWRSAAAAAVFAVHPLHVESVAWVSERKDVLSGLFFWLALGAYARYVVRPSPGRHGVVTGLLLLGLLAKSMLVTLPLLLLVLDIWPLGRLRPGSGMPRSLVLEKMPWLGLAAVFSIVTIVAQVRGSSLQTLENLPFSWRMQNALLSYVRYLGNALWPERLYFLHPYPTHPPGVGPALAAFALLAALTVLALSLVRRFPALAAGWFWYLGLLVPVIGLVQVGSQTIADRYMYLPLAGVSLAVLWPLADLLRGRPVQRAAGAFVAVVTVCALAITANAQARRWESGLTLYGRSLEQGSEDEKWLAHYGLGVAFGQAGDRGRAKEHYLASIALRPSWAGSFNNYAAILLKEGRAAEALAQFREAIRIAPKDPRGHYGAGLALAALGRDEPALLWYRDALRLNPGLSVAYTDLGAALARLGRLLEAELVFREGMRLRPEDPLLPYNLGLTLAALGRQGEAIAAFDAAVRLRPDFADAYNDLGVSCVAAGDIVRATSAFEAVLRIQPGHVAARDNLSRARTAGRTRP